MNADKKREREKKTVSLMIRLYCRKRHHTSGGLCAECEISQTGEADIAAFAHKGGIEVVTVGASFQEIG